MDMICQMIETDSVENPVSITIILPQEKHYKTKILGLILVKNSLKIDFQVKFDKFSKYDLTFRAKHSKMTFDIVHYKVKFLLYDR